MGALIFLAHLNLHDIQVQIILIIYHLQQTETTEFVCFFNIKLYFGHLWRLLNFQNLKIFIYNTKMIGIHISWKQQKMKNIVKHCWSAILVNNILIVLL